MYTLTLTQSDRQAIDWVGNRYGHGNDLFKLLMYNCDSFPIEQEWHENGNMSFAVPEHVAWHIREIGEECEYRWDCFATSLANKMTEFCNKIV